MKQQLYTLEEVVFDLLRQCGIDTSIRSEPPIPIKPIVTQCHFEFIEVEDAGWGSASRDGKIWVDRKGSPGQQRFGTAYHLGHLLLNPPRERRSLSTLSPPMGLDDWLAEHARALDFAGELLMPRRFIIPALNEYLNDEQLAALFGVPKTHVSIRVNRMRFGQNMSGVS